LIARPPWREDLGLYFAPIRHHSPACARHLERLIDEVRPAQVLIEAPADFEPLLHVLVDPATRPPVAVVAFRRPQKAAASVSAVSYFPFCAHSPEFVALERATAAGATVRFIDLPMTHRAMWATPSEEDASADSEPEPAAEPEALTQERVFDSSDYVKALCARYGCRDQNELWDHLFETRADGTNWRTFFSETGAYCAHVRESSIQTEPERRENDARERAMIAGLNAARAAGGPVVIVTGGFHTPALLDALDVPARPAEPAAAASTVSSYVIRYGFEQLDHLNGYAAGLPLPGFYDRLWRRVRAGESGEALWSDLAADLLVAFGAWLREFRPGLARSISVPTVAAALQSAVALARLRGRPGPGREDLLDACRSTFVKGERADGDPLLAEFAHFLCGSTFGDIPSSAGSPPLVEAVRAAAKGHGLRIDDGERRRRELDIHRNPKHRALSRFFHATALVQSRLADRTAGPDLGAGAKVDLLFEEWSYAWSPMVEARLIDLASQAETLEAACLAEIRRSIAALDDDGRGRSAPALVPILVTAVQAGLPPGAANLSGAIERALVEDGDFASLVTALRGLDALWRARGALELDDPRALGRLVSLAFDRATYLLPGIATVDEARLGDALEALASLRAIVEGAEEPEVSARFREAIAELLDTSVPPSVEGAAAAVAYLAGMLDGGALLERVRGTIGGAYVNPAERVAYVRGAIAISRELLWNVPELIDATDEILAELDEDEFIELLPHLRLAFTQLDPRETDRVAERLAERHGDAALEAAGGVAYGVDEDEVRANLSLARELELALEADGLGAWLRLPEGAA